MSLGEINGLWSWWLLMVTGPFTSKSEAPDWHRRGETWSINTMQGLLKDQGRMDGLYSSNSSETNGHWRKNISEMEGCSYSSFKSLGSMGRGCSLTVWGLPTMHESWKKKARKYLWSIPLARKVEKICLPPPLISNIHIHLLKARTVCKNIWWLLMCTALYARSLSKS